uniref:ras-related protein Rab-12-like n=1 Tax=Styela clava TaxID=7725 RepID=UPI00193986BF|nr:ras-related protein Rab-12-like [Styela clava]
MMELSNSRYLPKSYSDESGINRVVRRTRSSVSRELSTANHDTPTHRRRPSAPLPSYSLSPAPQHKIQLILIGDRNVGKTCVLERFTEDQFHTDLTSTVGIDFKLKTITVGEKSIRLQIWDTAGQERFNSITTAYYRGARGIIVMYDVTRIETFLNVRNWLTLVDEYGRSDAVIAIVGNKYDIKRNQVDQNKARKFAQERGYLFYETSAKNNMNIEALFLHLISEVLKKHPVKRDRNSINGAPQIREDTPKPEQHAQEKSFRCC